LIYLDSSALLKALFDEDESAALQGWLASRANVPKLTSELSKVEVIRVCRRANDAVVANARRLLAGLDLMTITCDIVERAGTIGEPVLRSLDAIHLASALSIGPALSALVAYDQRLLAAAEAVGLPAVAPV
jgi:predicted nucleic acid-binding protein